MLALQAEHVVAAGSLESVFNAIGAVMATTAQARTASAGPPRGPFACSTANWATSASPIHRCDWLMSRWVSCRRNSGG